MLRGDAAAMAEFADGYAPALYRFARSRTGGNSDLARDVVQTTLCKTLEKLSTYRGESPLFTWLCAACRNEIGMYFRHARRFPEQGVEHEDTWDGAAFLPRRPADSPESEATRSEASAHVHRALDLLPPHYARALEWKYLEDLPVVEIAARLSVRPKAAESLLTRARGAFREVFQRLEREASHAVAPTPAREEAAGHERTARAPSI
jgi:RNA polymerase sigma-70 factor (ECF subfamily)